MISSRFSDWGPMHILKLQKVVNSAMLVHPRLFDETKSLDWRAQPDRRLQSLDFFKAQGYRTL